MSEYKKVSDWEWLSDIVNEFDITEKRPPHRKNAQDFTSLEAQVYSAIKTRYKPRLKPHFIDTHNSHDSEERISSMKIHKDQVETMRKMGYELMLDGDTFYQIGYEADPHLSTTFDMHQAYEIHRFIGELS